MIVNRELLRSLTTGVNQSQTVRFTSLKLEF